jgi:hypothetical protein
VENSNPNPNGQAQTQTLTTEQRVKNLIDSWDRWSNQPNTANSILKVNQF